MKLLWTTSVSPQLKILEYMLSRTLLLSRRLDRFTEEYEGGCLLWGMEPRKKSLLDSMIWFGARLMNFGTLPRAPESSS